MFQGRLNRKDFLRGVVAAFVVLSLVASSLGVFAFFEPALVKNNNYNGHVTHILLYFALFISYFQIYSLVVRRLHDFGMGGLFSWLVVILFFTPLF